MINIDEHFDKNGRWIDVYANQSRIVCAHVPPNGGPHNLTVMWTARPLIWPLVEFFREAEAHFKDYAFPVQGRVFIEGDTVAFSGADWEQFAKLPAATLLRLECGKPMDGPYPSNHNLILWANLDRDDALSDQEIKSMDENVGVYSQLNKLAELENSAATLISLTHREEPTADLARQVLQYLRSHLMPPRTMNA